MKKIDVQSDYYNTDYMIKLGNVFCCWVHHYIGTCCLFENPLHYLKNDSLMLYENTHFWYDLLYFSTSYPLLFLT